MDNTCHRCGAIVAESAPFCGGCGAPQIRVNAPAQEETAPALSTAGIGEPVTGYAPGRLNWKKALAPAVQGGIAMATGTIILVTLFPIWMIGGAWVAVRLYRRRVFARALSLSDGAKLGALTGLIGFGFFSVITAGLIAVQTFVLHQGNQFRDLMRAAVQQAAGRNQDPMAQQMAQWIQTPEGLTFLVILSMVLLFFAFLLLGSLGGVFGASGVRKRGA